jgi:exosortase/archaeosortase family protein
MTTSAAASRPRDLRLPAWWLAGSLGALLSGLWTIQIYPLAGGILAPFTVLTAQLTAFMLAAIGLPVTREAATLVHAGGFACEVDVACTALIPAALLAATMAVVRATPRTHFTGIVIGALLLVLVNQLRLVSLVWLGVHAPGYFDVAHNLLWPALLILTIGGYGFIWLCIARR